MDMKDIEKSALPLLANFLCILKFLIFTALQLQGGIEQPYNIHLPIRLPILKINTSWNKDLAGISHGCGCLKQIHIDVFIVQPSFLIISCQIENYTHATQCWGQEIKHASVVAVLSSSPTASVHIQHNLQTSDVRTG